MNKVGVIYEEDNTTYFHNKKEKTISWKKLIRGKVYGASVTYDKVKNEKEVMLHIENLKFNMLDTEKELTK